MSPPTMSSKNLNIEKATSIRRGKSLYRSSMARLKEHKGRVVENAEAEASNRSSHIKSANA